MEGLKAMFILYAVLGIAGGLVYRLIPAAGDTADSKPRFALGQSRPIVLKLAALFSIDSFAGGFAVQSLLALVAVRKVRDVTRLRGRILLLVRAPGGASYPAAAWIARRIGLLEYDGLHAHPFEPLPHRSRARPESRNWPLRYCLSRSALSQMDVPTRSSYVMAVVAPAERAAAASVTSVPRGLASAASPALAGALFAAGHVALPFVICGVMKILYDVLLLWTFRHVRPPEETVA